MNEFINPPIGGLPYLYGSNADVSVSSRFVATLTMHLQKSVLEQVLSEAMLRFPNIAIGVVEDDGQYVFSHVDAPVPVFDLNDCDQPCVFGDPSLNGYMFKISMSDKTVCFDFSRALVDEQGMVAFVKAVIYRYIDLAGHPVANDGTVKILSDVPLDAEGADALPRMDDLSASRPVWYMDAKAAKGSVPGALKEDVVQVRIPQSKLKGDRMQLVNIPVTYLAPVFSHAVYESLEGGLVQGEYIVASVQINLRPYLPSASMSPYTTPIYLAYNRNLREYPYGTVLMSQKKLLEAQLKNDALAYSAQRKINEIEKAFERRKSIDERKAAFSNYNEKVFSRATYDICRVGNLILPDAMQRYVTEFYPVIPAGPYVYSLTVSNYKGDVVVTVCGRKGVRAVCDRFVGVLAGIDVDAFVADEFSFTPMRNQI